MTKLEGIRARLMSWVEENTMAKRNAASILEELESEVRRLERRAVLEEMATVEPCKAEEKT